MRRVQLLVVIGVSALLATGAVVVWAPDGHVPAASSGETSARPLPDGGPTSAPPRAASPAPESVETHTVWHWNIAGSALHGGAVDGGLVDVLVASVLARGADLVSLNEVCRQQYDAVAAALAAAEWSDDPARSGAFHTTIEGDPGTCGGRPYGLALFSATPLTDVRSLLLPDDGSGTARVLLCAATGARSAIRLCTTHITTSSSLDPRSGHPHNALQLQAVLRELEDRSEHGETVVLAGDLNAQPHYGRLDGWYDRSVSEPANGGNSGHYRELDDTDPGCPGYGQSTALGPPGAAPPCGAGAKVDHVFVREDRIVGQYGADALEIPHRCPGVTESPGVHGPGVCSDHHVLVGTVTVEVRP